MVDLDLRLALPLLFLFGLDDVWLTGALLLTCGIFATKQPLLTLETSNNNVTHTPVPGIAQNPPDVIQLAPISPQAIPTLRRTMSQFEILQRFSLGAPGQQVDLKSVCAE
mmetsp:Transcript_35436/g.56676  ORF Transcript_35436/g.56676 Transcript_35436/m.56676 type:complete len:110 (-) Transcript_35436:270-599(-)